MLVIPVFLATLLATGSRSQSAPTASTAGQHNSVSAVAILAGRLIDVHTGHVTTNAYIVIEKDRIARIVTAAPVYGARRCVALPTSAAEKGTR